VSESRRAWLVPTPRLIALAVGWLLFAIAASFEQALGGMWLMSGGLISLAMLIDALQLWRSAIPSVQRKISHALAVGVDTEVTLLIENRDAGPLQLQVIDHYPAHCEVQNLPQRLRIARGASARIAYRLRPIERGEMRFASAELWMSTGLGLFARRCRAGDEQHVRVYPNFAALVGYTLLAADNRLSQAGVLQRRRRGEGLDFHQLREYREGDAIRQIDWKATSRMRKLVSREYRDERDQQILLMLDCGRRMHARDGALSHLDHALNAALMLAYVALRQGDAVGLLAFGGVDRYLPPRKSQSTVNALLAGTFDLQASLSVPDYYTAAVRLMGLNRKRSLVVILSNLRDEDDDTLKPAVSLLRQRHLVVLASLRENILDAALRAPVDDLDGALIHAATAQYLIERQRAFARLEAARIPCIDVEPQALPLALVNRYTELKRRGAI
jgi:uncharacterized protein (DUF58 family)